MAEMKKIVVVGAGKTGRGFIGRLLAEDKREIIFIDNDAAVVDKLNRSGSFDVNFFGNSREGVRVDNYTAYTWDNAVLDDAELIFVSVCGPNLKDVGVSLSKLLDADKHYYIVTCENASHPSKTLREAIGLTNISVSEATVFCTTIEADGINISSENYPYLQCDADLLDGYIPDVSSVKALGSFSDFLTRKLYTYNAASCVIAYIGALRGFEDYGEAANNPEILELLDRNYAVTNTAMCRRYGYDEQEQAEFAALSKVKFCDRTIIDTVERNARDPRRKLAYEERIIGPARLLHEYGLDASVLEMTAAAAVLYSNPRETEWNEIRATMSAEKILKTVCGLDENTQLYKNILGYIREFEK